jgi:SOS-response transcriptional repressor LexA
MIAPGLSSREVAVLECVYSFVEEHGYPPSVWCIGHCLGIAELQLVASDLQALERKGYVRWPRRPDGPQSAKPDAPPLSERQAAVLYFLQSYAKQNGYPPTVREIGQHFGIASPNGVVCHLQALERKGYIHRRRFRSRAISAVRKARPR